LGTWSKATLTLTSLVLMTGLTLLSAFAAKKELQGLTLKKMAEKIGFSIGTAVNYGALSKDARYRKILVREFNRITPENDLKMGMVHYAPDKYNFAQADQVVNFALSNGMTVRGHTLVWYMSIPDWLKNTKYTSEELKAVLKDHVQTMVKHYKGKIKEWDVVNEAISEDGSGLRDSIWLQGIGPEYIELAFQWAHEADPNAKLLYNDYYTEDLSRKANTQYELLKTLKQKGVPIHGVGLQMHQKISNRISAADLVANIKRLSALGLSVNISEMDVDIQQPWSLSLAEKEQLQANVYRDVLQVCRAFKSCESFTLWGFTDLYSWRSAGKPLPFTSDYKTKPAYEALKEALVK